MNPVNNVPPIVYIDSDLALMEFCLRLSRGRLVALDTEFVGEKSYFSKLEIVQLYGGDQVGIVDAQAIRDWKPLAELMANPAVLKVLHAADQDVELMRRVTGAPPRPLFDTQLAAAFLGYGSQPSLASMLKGVLDVEVSGKETTSDWSHRPLTEGQLEYAALDVAYLPALHAHLAKGLRETGRESWWQAEQDARLEGILAAQDVDEGELYRRVKEWASLNGGDLAVLRELAIWRDRTARERNVPRRTLLTDETLIELARHQPDNREKMQKLRRINVGQAMRWFDDLHAVIRKARNLPKEQWPRKAVGERMEIPTGLLELCQALLRSESEQHGIAPALIATTGDMQTLLNEREALDVVDIPLLKGWRRELVGGKLVDLLRGRMQVTVSKEGNLMFTPVGGR